MQRPNPITAIVNVHPGSYYAKYNGQRFMIEQINGPIEKLVFCLRIDGILTDCARSELKEFGYDLTKNIVKVPDWGTTDGVANAWNRTAESQYMDTKRK